MAEKNLRDLFEEKARKGDGAYAIACALMDLSDSQVATAKALNRLGLGNASTHMGAIELLASELKSAAQTIAESIDGVGSAIGASE